MGIAWDNFITDERAGNVGGTFEFFDTEAQAVIIRASDDALISTYDDVELGQWLDAVFAENTRIGHFGLSQFVPRHNYNGEIWAVGITPTLVAAETGRFPTPEVPAGFYVYRYAYWKDLTDSIESVDTTEQTDNPIKDAGVTIKNLPEGIVNKSSSIFSPGSRIVTKIGMGNSNKMGVSQVFVDQVSWQRAGDTMQMSGRNALGYYLGEQTFDEDNAFATTKVGFLESILQYSGVNYARVFIDPSGTDAVTLTFDPADKILDGMLKALDLWGWKVVELPNGRIVIGGDAFIKTHNEPSIHEFNKDEVFARELVHRADGAYSRIAVQSYDTATSTVLTEYVDLTYFDGWSLGGNKTLYIKTVDDLGSVALASLAAEYAKAYQNIGVTVALEMPIHPEIQAGDVIEIADAGDDDYILSGVVTEVRNIITNESARTIVSINSGGTIEEDGGEVTTYTAANVTGDTRRMELIDVIRKAAKEKESATMSITGIDGGEI